MSSVTNLRTEISLKRVDAVFKKDTNHAGTVLWMKPSHVVLRLDNADDPTKIDYEAYICDGKSVFAYNGVQKTVSEFKLPVNHGRPDNLMFDMVFGVSAAGMKERFDISVFKTDDLYIYLDIKPRSDKDKRDFTHLRLALYGPGEVTAKFAYLPAKVYVRRPNSDSEIWTFNNPQVNLPGVTEKMFQFVEPPKGWTVLKAPPASVEK